MLIERIHIKCTNVKFVDINYFATEIKSEMRFWFRIINSTQKPLDNVYIEEGKLFGNSTTTKSPIKILVKQDLANNFLNIFLILQTNIKSLSSSLIKDMNDQEKLEWYVNLFTVSFILGDIGKNRKKLMVYKFSRDKKELVTKKPNVIKKFFNSTNNKKFCDDNFSRSDILDKINQVQTFNESCKISLYTKSFKKFFSKQIEQFSKYTMLKIWIYNDTQIKDSCIQDITQTYKEKFNFNNGERAEQIIMTKFKSFNIITYINIKREDVKS